MSAHGLRMYVARLKAAGVTPAMTEAQRQEALRRMGLDPKDFGILIVPDDQVELTKGEVLVSRKADRPKPNSRLEIFESVCDSCAEPVWVERTSPKGKLRCNVCAEQELTLLEAPIEGRAH